MCPDLGLYVARGYEGCPSPQCQSKPAGVVQPNGKETVQKCSMNQLLDRVSSCEANQQALREAAMLPLQDS